MSGHTYKENVSQRLSRRRPHLKKLQPSLKRLSVLFPVATNTEAKASSWCFGYQMMPTVAFMNEYSRQLTRRSSAKKVIGIRSEMSTPGKFA
ncbi:hypothetical protein D2E44_14925 [Mycobacteroides abscessus]|nr:hypothetical protein D2E44_14925 [Mycobacteroides abscessus]